MLFLKQREPQNGQLPDNTEFFKMLVLLLMHLYVEKYHPTFT